MVVYGLTIGSIQLIAPNKIITEMPDKCPENSANCARIAHDGTSYRTEHIESLSINATTIELQLEIERWFNEQFASGVLYSDTDENNYIFLHGVDTVSYTHLTLPTSDLV